ncbi:unnamed protein product [Nesidiocoris tenuis]|uniref:F5/8 type C domain-containing protein n=1 Tax=Nesidiocoris tenuis TaxID=355587 RepID=A0A6H5HEW6_9HEMI|nr:unnamed protein product [Nesidiocoris tenuis]
MFSVPIEARYIRVVPLTWSQYPALRIELLGCDYTIPTTTTATPEITTTAATTTTTMAPTSTSKPEECPEVECPPGYLVNMTETVEVLQTAEEAPAPWSPFGKKSKWGNAFRSKGGYGGHAGTKGGYQKGHYKGRYKGYGNHWTTTTTTTTTPKPQVVCPKYQCLPIEEQAIQVCEKPSCKDGQEPLSQCSSVVNLEKLVSQCMEAVCACAERGNTTEQCRCPAILEGVTECQTLLPKADLAMWRVNNDCPVKCPDGLVYKACFNKVCEPCCAELMLEDACPTADRCFPGCYCPDGLVRSYDKCVRPSDCRDFCLQVWITNKPCLLKPDETCLHAVTLIYKDNVIQVVNDRSGETQVPTWTDAMKASAQALLIAHHWRPMPANVKVKDFASTGETLNALIPVLQVLSNHITICWFNSENFDNIVIINCLKELNGF